MGDRVQIVEFNSGDCGKFETDEKIICGSRITTYLCPQCKTPIGKSGLAATRGEWICFQCGIRGKYIDTNEKRVKMYQIKDVPKKMRVLAIDLHDKYTWAAYPTEEDEKVMVRNCPSCGSRDALKFSSDAECKTECPKCGLVMILKKPNEDERIIGRVVLDPKKNYYINIPVKAFFSEDVVPTERDELGRIMCPCCNNSIESNSPILYSGKIVECSICDAAGVIFSTNEKESNSWKITILKPPKVFQKEHKNNAYFSDIATIGPE